jgi:2-C-methyl-D-erythritol 4-phosphate cytidylyltransferase
MRISAIIAAAGAGRRFGGTTPKQFSLLDGRPILFWSMKALMGYDEIRELVIAAPAAEVEAAGSIMNGFQCEVPVKIIPGGQTRQESVKLGLAATDPNNEWVAVHDAARPFVTAAQVEAVCLMAQEVGAAILAIPVQDTVKKVDENSIILHTIDRNRLYLSQTPQVCRREDLVSAYRLADEKGLRATDEAGLLELLGLAVGVIQGSPTNIKITSKEDLELAQAVITVRSHE